MVFIVINENITNDLIATLKTSLSNTNNMKIGISSTPCKGFVIRILSHNTEDMESIFFSVIVLLERIVYMKN